MKLYNKTKVAPDILDAVLVAAGRCTKARTTGAVVKVTQGHRACSSGYAKRANFVNTWHLRRVRKWKEERVNTDGGYFSIVLPQRFSTWDALDLAVSFFQVAIHEWVHIADFQAMSRGEFRAFDYARAGSRRRKHDTRPEELRAIDTTDAALERGAVSRNQDAIIALALEIERVSRG